MTIKPGTLARGPDVSGVHLEGKTIVDGDVRVTLKAPRVLLYGKSDDVYVAATGDKEWGNVKLWQVTASGATKQLAKFIDPFNTLLDADGGQVAYSYGDSTSKPTIAVYDLALKERGLGQRVRVAADAAGLRRGLRRGVVRRLQGQDDPVGHRLGRDRPAEHEVLQLREPGPQPAGLLQQGPVQRRLPGARPPRRPQHVLWTNCDERIEAVSPDGKRVATIALLSDGIGPADVMVRKIGGAPVVHYSIGGYFGRIWWETGTKLLMEANGKTQAATVRCKVDVCNRASDLVPTPDL